VLALVLCTGIASAAAPDRPKRGDYPGCQQECLVRLKKTMNQLSAEYERTGNRLLYENRVEQARVVYDDCIDACKERFPVK
jgi:hypothetical protein